MRAYQAVSFVLALSLVSLAVALVALPTGSVVPRGVMLVLASPEPLSTLEPEKVKASSPAPVKTAPRKAMQTETPAPGVVLAPPETASSSAGDAGKVLPMETASTDGEADVNDVPAAADSDNPSPAVDARQQTEALAAYHQRIASLIEAQKRYPEIARRLKHEGSVRIRFRLSADGRLLNSSVDAGSGFDELDKAALDAVLRVAKYPSFPHPLGSAERNFVVTLSFNLS